VLLGDGYFEKRDKEIYDITRFDCTGTSDVIRWSGLAAAIELQFELPSETVARYQMELVRLLRDGLAGLGAQFRTPDADAVGESELSAMLTFFFSEERLKVSDLRQALFQDHKIWIQPDFLSPNPGCGGRISCHYSVSETEILKLVEALCGYLI
jgi:selenocysteine lyase/cysteine desulfurase